MGNVSQKALTCPYSPGDLESFRITTCPIHRVTWSQPVKVMLQLA